MLILARPLGESIFIDQDIEVRVLSVDGQQVRIGIDAPEAIKILREELAKQDRPVTAT